MATDKIKDKMITLMSEFIARVSDCPYDKFDIEPGDCDEDCDKSDDMGWTCSPNAESKCWIKYFEQKASGVKFVGIRNDEDFWKEVE